MDLLRINDACHVTGLSRKTIYRYMDKGILEYQEIDGKRHIQLKDLKKIQRKKQTDPKIDTVSDTKSEIKDLKEEIKSLKNSILQLTECLETVTRTLISDTNNFVSRHKKDTKKTAITAETLSGDNERRAEDAKNRVFHALDLLLKNNALPMYRGKISPSGVQKETGIDRGTISKYLQDWLEKNRDKNIGTL